MGKIADKVKPGVVTGSDLQFIFRVAQENNFAIPAVNVVGSSSINAVMEAAKNVNAPIMIQFSNGGAVFNAGKGLKLDGHEAGILGAVAGAKHIHTLAEAYGVRVVLHTDHAAKKLLPWIDGLLDASEKNFAETGKPLFSSHTLDLSEEPIEENIEISKRYLERMAKMGMTLEIELGITGGEEDGVDNSDVDASKLYTQPEEVCYAYEELSKVSPNFTIAASFGNVHGVYKPGNVKLTPKILDNSQKYIVEKLGLSDKLPVDFGIIIIFVKTLKRIIMINRNKLGVTFLLLMFAVLGFSQDLEYRDGHFYKKGMLYSGKDIEYFENGNPKIERNIKNGHEDGFVIAYFDNGEKQEQRSYIEGKKDGLWITWDEKGVKLGEARYKDDIKDGDWFIWNSEGILLYEMHYTQGKKSGIWKMYDNEGKLTEELSYE